MTNVKNRTFLVSMDVASLFTNIPLNEDIEIVCVGYENFYKVEPTYSCTLLPARRAYINPLRKYYFQFNGKQFTYKSTEPRWVQTQDFSLANIFMAYIETQSLSQGGGGGGGTYFPYILLNEIQTMFSQLSKRSARVLPFTGEKCLIGRLPPPVPFPVPFCPFVSRLPPFIVFLPLSCK